jgi:hypothetical protein
MRAIPGSKRAAEVRVIDLIFGSDSEWHIQAHCWVADNPITPSECGGDDETRTRDLCRDSGD